VECGLPRTVLSFFATGRGSALGAKPSGIPVMSGITVQYVTRGAGRITTRLLNNRGDGAFLYGVTLEPDGDGVLLPNTGDNPTNNEIRY
jgi:hypothetical protein